jgi:ATP-dependent RNA helicase DHX36
MTLAQYMSPEFVRTPLEEVVLQIKILGLGRAANFITKLLEPPSEMALKLALDNLHTINAIDKDEHLTPLGFHLAHLPMDPYVGKMILMGAIFGCLDPVLSIAASLAFKDPFVTPLGKEELVDEIRKVVGLDSFQLNTLML